jgi:hypothetical protein
MKWLNRAIIAVIVFLILLYLYFIHQVQFGG